LSMTGLFENEPIPPSCEPLEDGAALLRGFASAEAGRLVEAVSGVTQAAPFRHLVTRGGYTMSVAMTNCGRVGWVSDAGGYRYDPIDPDSGKPWPPIPDVFLDLAVRAAATGGFPNYSPMPASSIVTLRDQSSACIRIAMRMTSGLQSYRFRWACRRFSCGAGNAAPIPCVAFAWKAGMSRCGAVRRVLPTMGSPRSRMASIC